MPQEYLIYGGVGAGLLLLIVILVILQGSGRKRGRDEQPMAASSAQRKQSIKASGAKVVPAAKRDPRFATAKPAPAPLQRVMPTALGLETTEVPDSLALVAAEAGPPRAIWKTRWGPLPPEVDAGEGFITLPPGVHAITEEALPTSEGDSWVVEFEARAAGSPTNGSPVTHWIGPMVLDANGEVLTWWTEQPPLTPGLPPRPSSAESRAPTGAARVCIGLQGCMPHKGSLAADVAVEFTGITLRKRD